MATQSKTGDISVVEIVRISSRPGLGDAFSERLRSAVELIADATGCEGLVVHRGVEDPDAFVLIVTWTSISAHEAWRSSDAAPRYRGQLADLQAGPAQFGHFRVFGARS